MEGSSQAKNQFDSFSRFDRTPTCDRLTDTGPWLIDSLDSSYDFLGPRDCNPQCNVIWTRLTYASPAWSGFITATDRQRVDAFLSCSKRCGFCPPDMPDFDQLLEDADDQLSERILNNTLYQLLPPQSAASQNYNLRRSTHHRQLHEHQGHLGDCNFITRLLYKNS